MFWSEAFLFPNIKLNFWSLTAIVNYVIVTLSLSCLSKAKVIKQDSLSKYMLHKISHDFSPMSILRLLALSAAQQTQSSHSHSKWAEKISLHVSWVMCVFSKDISKISQKYPSSPSMCFQMQNATRSLSHFENDPNEVVHKILHKISHRFGTINLVSTFMVHTVQDQSESAIFYFYFCFHRALWPLNKE